MRAIALASSLRAGQEDEPEVIRRVDIEGAALYHENLLLAEQIEHETLVVDDVEPLPVEFRKHVQRTPPVRHN